jgi:hypothetical protein
MTYPNEYCNVRLTKSEIISNILTNKSGEIKLVPTLTHKRKRVLIINAEQAQTLYMYLIKKYIIG